MKSLFTVICAVILLFVTGCTEKSTLLGENQHDDTTTILAWIWAYDEEADSLRVYHSKKGVLKAAFKAAIHPMMHILRAGPAGEPTLWMAAGNAAYAFTRGFHPHGDHAHMEIPEALPAIAGVYNPAHMGAAESGDTVAFANDDSSTVSVIDVKTCDTRGIRNGSPHSAAILADGCLLTTHMNQKWVKIIAVAKDSVLDSFIIDTLAHGDAYYAAHHTAFIACKTGIEVIDVANRVKKTAIPYSGPGRTSFLYHGADNAVAVGLHNIGGAHTDKVLLLNMAKKSLEYLTIDGAALDWSINGGHFALSEDGAFAVLSDLKSPKVYRVNVDPASSGYKTVMPISVAKAGGAVGIDHDGGHVWVQNDTAVTMYHIESGNAHAEKTFGVAPGTDWIYITSYDGLVVEETDNHQ